MSVAGVSAGVAKQEGPSSSGPVKEDDFDFSFESDDDEPDLGSTAMYEAIFQKAKKKVSLSSKDLKKVKEDAAKFFENSSTKTKQKESSKKKRKGEETAAPKVEEKIRKIEVQDEDEDDLNLSQESRDLLKSCQFLCEDKPTESRESSEEDNSSTSSSSEYCQVDYSSTRSNRDYECEEEEQEQIQKIIDETRRQHGELILCQAVFMGKKYPLKIYENYTISEVRELIMKKVGVVEWVELYHGNFTVLEDRHKVKEYGIKSLDDIDAFIKEKTDKELFMSGSNLVMRFKLQTDDRKGRSGAFVYVRKSAPMREAVKKYCEENGVDSAKVKLKFDGDWISLNATPEECDLEGDECIDVIVTG